MTIFRKVQGPGFWDFLEFNRMRNQMDKLWKAAVGKVERFKDGYAGVFPLINIHETDDNITLTAELPGVKVEDLELSIKSDTLSLKGEKKVDERPAEANFFRQERIFGSFRRSITLPAKIDPDKAEAKLKNGIIIITLPKAAEAKAHQVSIKSE
ncbi:MAG: Hsp20/alpha crystallin family protein [Deltaproteobacteria bacterium]|nr:Hsp20/alpha crystallin family protein [Deltaproteobacteria bacterium]